jgi:RimJ/RimL family protein N-acetyltransferase
MIIEAARLSLRPLKDADIEPWVAMFSDVEVMQYVGSSGAMSRESAEKAFTLWRQALMTKGYGWWAIEVKGGPSFAGVIMLQDFPLAPFAPAIEVGWILPRAHWGNGYATESARAVLDYAFTVLGVDQVLSGARAPNLRSRRVMERLGMTHDPIDDFDDPDTPDGPANRVVLYRLKRNATLEPRPARS